MIRFLVLPKFWDFIGGQLVERFGIARVRALLWGSSVRGRAE